MKSSEILFEAINYNKMFDDEFIEMLATTFPKGGVHKNTIEPTIKNVIRDAKKILKKNDRIVWFLRLYKLLLVGTAYTNGTNPDTTEAEKVESVTIWANKQLQKHNRKTKGKRYKSVDELVGKLIYRQFLIPTSRLDDFYRVNNAVEAVFEKFEHWFSLGSSEIDNFVFGWESISDIYVLFDKYEKEWKETRKRQVSVNEDHDLLIDFGDGYAWYDLNQASCPEEGSVMGHCGNEPAMSDPNQTIFSLRKDMGKGKLKPVLTFIYHKKEKALGEMKGFGNEKPDTKYHKYIVKLLMHPLIKQVSGGGYMPESNFALSDLSQQEAEKLYKKKPQLFSPVQRWSVLGK